MWDMSANTRFWGAASGQIAIMMLFMTLTACSSGRDVSRQNLAPPPPALTRTDPINLADRAPRTIGSIAQGDRIILENQALGSRRSEDGKRTLAFKVDTDKTDFEGASIRYTIKLGRGKSSSRDKTHCLYPSRIQGLAPSAYRELVKRKNNTVWQELRALRVDLMD
jgi:hypothetical protein